MIDEALRQLIEFINTASPVIWESTIRQVYVETFAKLIWMVGLAVAGFYLMKLGNYFGKKKDKASYSDEFEYGVASALAYIFSAIAITISFSLMVSAITHFANPEFYAIQYLINTLK